MKKHWRRITIGLGCVTFVLVLALFVLARKTEPTHITFGMSFNTPYALELGLDPETVLNALVYQLGVRHFRLAAHWPLTEPTQGRFEFGWLDQQLDTVREAGGTVILGVGRRLPRWPECHIPEWAKTLDPEIQQAEILDYIEAVVTRYRDDPVITHWQVENEPFLEVFAYEHCGELDEAFLDKEIALVRTLDNSRPILVTDSGNLGTWSGAYRRGDAFGTSVYVYFWNPELGQFKTILPPWFYRVKENLMQARFGEKPTFLIELSLEPWLLEPVIAVPLNIQYERMDIEKMNEIIAYAKGTRFDRQYLWGGEWWYWLREQGETEFWNWGQRLFESNQ